MKEDIFIFAGEISADAYGANLIEEIRKYRPNKFSFFGVSGPKMKKQNIKTLLEIKNFETMGFLDIATSLPRLIKNFQYLKNKILKKKPSACIFIDYPDFNLRLQNSLRKNGYTGKIIHYVCPSIWAWRKKRIFDLEKNLNLLLTIFPFEKKLFSSSSLKVNYIGHPLIFKLQKYKYENWKYSNNKLLGIFPGSRKNEIEKNLPLQLKAAFKILKKYPNFSIAISISDKNFEPIIKKISRNYMEKIIFIPSFKNYDLMNHLTFAIATSGTINLELALHSIPTIVTYKIKPLDAFIAKNIFKIKLAYFCIVNILSQKQIFPELYGPNFTLENILFWANKILLESSFRKKIVSDCNIIKKNLAPISNPNKNAALSIIKTIENF